MSDNTMLANAKTLTQAGDFEAAETILIERLQTQPIPTDALLLLAQLYFNASKLSQAVALLNEHRSLRECADSLREYYVGERMNELAAELLHALPKNGSLENLIDQAVLAQISGNTQAALTLCRNVLSFQPNNAFALNHLGRALFNAKQAPEAQHAFEQAIQSMPEYYQAWHNLGHVLRAKNDVSGAEKAYQKAIEIAPFYQSALLILLF
jgi:tetratricopeptide (TPR) repeat protein